MDAVSLKLARNYTNEKLNSLPSNRPTKTVSFDGGIYSVGNDVVNGQFSDIVIKGQSVNQDVKNGNFAGGTTDWTDVTGAVSASNNIGSITGLGTSATVRAKGGTSIKCTENKKVYIRFLFKVKNSLARFVRCHLSGTGGGASYLEGLSITSPIENQLYVYSTIVTLDSTLVGDLEVAPAHLYLDAATANGKVMEVQEVMVIDMTAEGLTALTADQMNTRFPNWLKYGVNSTLPVTVKIIIGNLVNKNNFVNDKFMDANTGTAIGASTTFCSDFEKVIGGSTIYADSGEDSHNTGHTFYDVNKKFIVGVKSSNDGAITVPINAYYFRSTFYKSRWNFDNAMVNYGTELQPYRQYTETSVTLPAGTVLRSVGSVKDEVNVTAGIKAQRVKGYILQASDIESYSTTPTNVDYVVLYKPLDYIGYNNVNKNDGNIVLEGYGCLNSTLSPDNIEFINQLGTHTSLTKAVIPVPKGTYANKEAVQAVFAGLALTYQLATPIVTKLPAQAPLQVFENGTVYVEPIGDASESTLPSVEMTIPTGTSNKFGVASHDYDGAAADWTLTNSESKCFMLAVSNAGGAANIIAPNRPGTMYAISNASGYAITIKKSGGTGVAVTNAKTVLVIHNGTDYTALTAEL